jgi:hypothetical protein
MWQVKNVAPWARKVAIRSLLLAGTATLLVPLALVPALNAQISIGVGIGAGPPVCSWGYYNYSPYGCAPSGYYGPGYFYNGIFLGVGPWSNWGYEHGWGGHRFDGPRGGRYVVGARGYRTQAGYTEHGGRGPYAARDAHNNAYHGNAARGGGHAPAARAGESHGQSHNAPSHNAPAHAAPAHNSGSHGGEPHGGGEHHD